jgi:uncharacterized protein (TIGR02145 family)
MRIHLKYVSENCKLSGAWCLMTFLLFIVSCTKDPVDEGSMIQLKAVDFLTQSTATFSGDIFGEMEHVERMGFCWSISPRPELDDNNEILPVEIGLFSKEITGLQPEKKYYARAFYEIEGEVFYSNQISFTLPETIEDFEGNEYATVRIGNQVWFAENLRSAFYRNGDPIDNGTLMGNFSTLQQPKFLFSYKDNPGMVDDYGHLYTWFAIMDNRGICPAGWRVPDRNDWHRLSLQLDALTRSFGDLQPGQYQISAHAGGSMKTTGTIENKQGLWQAPNAGATNRSRFSVVPGGWRDPSGAFDGMGFNATFWSATSVDAQMAQMFYTHFNNSGFHTNTFSKHNGYSVRCVR